MYIESCKFYENSKGAKESGGSVEKGWQKTKSHEPGGRNIERKTICYRKVGNESSTLGQKEVVFSRNFSCFRHQKQERDRGPAQQGKAGSCSIETTWEVGTKFD